MYHCHCLRRRLKLSYDKHAHCYIAARRQTGRSPLNLLKCHKLSLNEMGNYCLRNKQIKTLFLSFALVSLCRENHFVFFRRSMYTYEIVCWGSTPSYMSHRLPAENFFRKKFIWSLTPWWTSDVHQRTLLDSPCDEWFFFFFFYIAYAICRNWCSRRQ